MLFARRQARPIGLDIGHDSIKMLQLSAPGKPLAVAAAARRALPARVPSTTGAALADVLRQMLVDAPFVGRRVAAALPSEIVHTRTLRVPIDADEAIDTSFAHADGLFPFDLNEATVRSLSTTLKHPGRAAFREVILFATRNCEVEAYLAELRAAGLTIDSLQINPLAAYRAAERFVEFGEILAMLDLGAARSTLVIGRGSSVEFVRSIEIGGRHVEQAIGHKLGLDESEVRQLRRRLAQSANRSSPRSDPVASAVFDATRGLAEHLAQQIAMCLRYHAITFRGQRPTRLAVVGGQATDPHLQHALSCATALQIEPINLLEGIDTRHMRPLDAEPPAGQWGACLGMIPTARVAGARPAIRAAA
ncbi:MAG TPA: pilus assembly protein PilM [Humisphaera sp.]|jgi:type IV pilus assembly protein PilM|nr:pilus assembly protein PilM [Humisphaera sp.]